MYNRAHRSACPQSVPPQRPSALQPAKDVDGGLEKAPVAQVLSTLGVQAEQGLSAAEAATRLQRYGPNAIVAKAGEPLGEGRGLLQGPDRADDRGGGAGLGDPRTLAGLPRHRGAPGLQRRARSLAGPQGLQRAGGVEEGAGARGDRAARRQMGHGGRREPGARRHRQDPARRHRPGGSAAGGGRLRLDRPVGADRRVAAGGEEGRRRGLFRQRGEAGRDDRRRHRHRRRDLLRAHRQARGRGRRGQPRPEGDVSDRQLPDRAGAGAGGGHGGGAGLPRHRRRRRLALGRRARHPAVRPDPARRLDPGGDAGGLLHHHGARGAGSVEAEGDRLAAGGDRGDGRGRHPLHRQDRDPDQERAEARRPDPSRRQGRAGGGARRRARLAAGGPRPDRHLRDRGAGGRRAP